MLSKSKSLFLLEITENSFIPLIVGLLFGLQSSCILLLIIGCFLIDIDHLFYFFYIIYHGKKSLKDIPSFASEEFKNHRPHLYVFHIYELLAVFLLITHLYSSGLYYLFFGFLINLVLDTITYILFYKSPEPWLKYLSFSYFLYKKFIHPEKDYSEAKA